VIALALLGRCANEKERASFEPPDAPRLRCWRRRGHRLPHRSMFGQEWM
jgi:hypothetical protein